MFSTFAKTWPFPDFDQQMPQPLEEIRPQIDSKWSADAGFLFKAMIRLSCRPSLQCIWILHEGIQYFPSHKEISFQRRNYHKQSSNIERKPPINKMRRAQAPKWTLVQNLTRNSNIQLKLLSFFFFPQELTSKRSGDKSWRNLVRDERKESEPISGEIGWPLHPLTHPSTD